MPVYVGFVLLSALVLSTVIYARGPWLAKLVLILTVPAYGWFVWHSLEDWKGYPVPHAPPDRSVLVSSLVREPEWIYLWAVPPEDEEPRAYRIPYTRTEHEDLQRAEAGQRGGVPQAIRRGARG